MDEKIQYMYIKGYYSAIKGMSSDQFCNMDDPWKHYAKCSKTQQDKYMTPLTCGT